MLIKRITFNKLNISIKFMKKLNHLIQNSDLYSSKEKANYSRSLLFYANILNNVILKNIAVPKAMHLIKFSSEELLEKISNLTFESNFKDLSYMLFGDNVIDNNSSRKRLLKVLELLSKGKFISYLRTDRSNFILSFSLDYLKLVKSTSLEFTLIEGSLVKILIGSSCSSLVLGLTYCIFKSRQSALKELSSQLTALSSENIAPDFIERQLTSLLSKFIEPHRSELRAFLEDFSIKEGNILAFADRCIEQLKSIFVVLAMATKKTVVFTKLFSIDQKDCLLSYISAVKNSLAKTVTSYLNKVISRLKDKKLNHQSQVETINSNSRTEPINVSGKVVYGTTETERTKINNELKALFN